MKHIQEPWTFEDRSPEGVCHIRSADGHRMAFAPCADFASRIVACVNACSGMEDPAAELARLRRVERAARAVLEWADPYSIPGDVAIPDAEQLRSALEG